jgi:hypothetical protein
MNHDNYASLEASKRLNDAGIVLETEAWWLVRYDYFSTSPNDGCPREEWFLSNSVPDNYEDPLPAPSMAEVWRELPPGTELRKAHSFTEAFNFTDTENADSIYPPCNSPDNPTDALIDLLIWVRGSQS